MFPASQFPGRGKFNDRTPNESLAFRTNLAAEFRHALGLSFVAQLHERAFLQRGLLFILFWLKAVDL